MSSETSNASTRPGRSTQSSHAHRIRERACDSVGAVVLVDRDDAGRSGGKRVVHFLADAGLHAVSRELPGQRAGGGADGGGCQERRGEEPDDETDAAAGLDALAA